MQQNATTRKHKVVGVCDSAEQSVYLEMTTKEMVKDLVMTGKLKVVGCQPLHKKPDEADFGYASMPPFTLLVPNGKPLDGPLQTQGLDGRVKPNDVKLQVPRSLQDEDALC